MPAWINAPTDFSLWLTISQELLIWTIFLTHEVKVFRGAHLEFQGIQGCTLGVPSKSDKGKGSFSVSVPGTFIGRNTQLLKTTCPAGIDQGQRLMCTSHIQCSAFMWYFFCIHLVFHTIWWNKIWDAYRKITIRSCMEQVDMYRVKVSIQGQFAS